MFRLSPCGRNMHTHAMQVAFHPHASISPTPSTDCSPASHLPQELPSGVKSLLSPGYLDYIVVPINQPCHWVCAVVDIKQQAVIYLDSIGVRHHKADAQNKQRLCIYAPLSPCAYILLVCNPWVEWCVIPAVVFRQSVPKEE